MSNSWPHTGPPNKLNPVSETVLQTFLKLQQLGAMTKALGSLFYA